MTQLSISFETYSPINADLLTGQNKTVYQHLSMVGSINTVIARREYYIYNLHSRISDLRNKSGVTIYDRMISVNGVTCKEYSLTPIENVR